MDKNIVLQNIKLPKEMEREIKELKQAVSELYEIASGLATCDLHDCILCIEEWEGVSNNPKFQRIMQEGKK